MVKRSGQGLSRKENAVMVFLLLLLQLPSSHSQNVCDGQQPLCNCDQFNKLLVCRNRNLVRVPTFSPREVFSVGWQELDLSTNNVNATAGRPFVNLTSLWYLDLQGNKLTVVERGYLHGLSNLIQLYLDNNLISHLEPGVFDDVRDLRSLHLTNNRLSRLQAGVFGVLVNLLNLDLNNNRLVSFDAGALHGLTNVQDLILSGNQLSSCSFSDRPFSDLTSLTNLDLSYNNITHLTPSFLPPLDKKRRDFVFQLVVKNNQIAQMLAPLPLTNLKLNLESNRLSTMSSWLLLARENASAQPLIREVSLVNNPLTCGLDAVVRQRFSTVFPEDGSGCLNTSVNDLANLIIEPPPLICGAPAVMVEDTVGRTAMGLVTYILILLILHINK